MRIRALLVAACILPLVGFAPRPRDPDEVKFRANTTVWNNMFTQDSVRFDARNNQIVWTLVARKDVRISTYEADLADADGVKLARVRVQFDPNYTTFKEKARVRAIAPVGAIVIADVVQVNVRERR